MKTISIEKFGMEYPRLTDNVLYNGGIHPVEAITVEKVVVDNNSTGFYLLSYNDMEIDSQKKEVFYTFLRNIDGVFTKVTLLDSSSVGVQIASGKITLTPVSLESIFFDTKFVQCEEPVKDIETLLNIEHIDVPKEKQADEKTLPDVRNVTIYCDKEMNLTLEETLEDGMKSYTCDLGTTLFEYLDNENIKINWVFVDLSIPLEEQIREVISYYRSLEEKYQRFVNGTAKYELLFIGPDGKVFKDVPFDQAAVDIRALGKPFNDIELYSYLKYANVIWAKFDYTGNVTEAETEDIQPLVDRLEKMYGTSTNSFHQI